MTKEVEGGRYLLTQKSHENIASRHLRRFTSNNWYLLQT